jgi:hypothetical protein
MTLLTRISPEGVRPRPKKRVEEDDEGGAGAMGPTPSLHALRVCQEGWWQPECQGMDRRQVYLVTIDTGALTSIARLDIAATAWEGTDQAIHPANGISGDPGCLEGSVSRVDSGGGGGGGVAPTGNLGVRRQIYKWLHPGTGCFEYPWCIHGFGAPYAATGRWRRTILAPQGTITFIPLYGEN